MIYIHFTMVKVASSHILNYLLFQQGDQGSTFKATIKYKWEYNGKAVGDNTNSLALDNAQVPCDVSMLLFLRNN